MDAQAKKDVGQAAARMRRHTWNRSTGPSPAIGGSPSCTDISPFCIRR